jgi:hypothetical protein
MVVARLIRAEFPQTLWQLETQNLAEAARRVAGRDQLIGEEEPERLFPVFEFRQAQMFQMDLREAFVALRPKLRCTPQFDEHGGIDRRRKGNREQRQNAVLAGKIEGFHTFAIATHGSNRGPGAKHEASLGEDQGPA